MELVFDTKKSGRPKGRLHVFLDAKYLGFSRLENLWQMTEFFVQSLKATNIIPNFTRVLIKCHHANP